jgi:hypothetical protein
VLLGDTAVLDTGIVLLHFDGSKEMLASLMVLDEVDADTVVV